MRSFVTPWDRQIGHIVHPRRARSAMRRRSGSAPRSYFSGAPCGPFQAFLEEPVVEHTGRKVAGALLGMVGDHHGEARHCSSRK